MTAPATTLLARWNLALAINAHPKLTAGARRVGIGLLGFLNNETGLCCPGMSRLAKQLHMTRRNVIRSIASLEEHAVVQVGRRRNGTASNIYIFPYLVTEPSPGTPTTLVSPSSPVTAASSSAVVTEPSPGGDIPVRQVVTPVSPKHSKGNTGRKTGRGSRLPDDWQPSEDDKAYARKKALSDEAIAHEAELFVNYWIGQPGQKGIKTARGWPAAWRTWCCKTVEFQKQRAGSNGPGARREAGKFILYRNSKSLPKWIAFAEQRRNFDLYYSLKALRDKGNPPEVQVDSEWPRWS